MSFTFGEQVTVTLGGGYPVTGTLEAVTPNPDGDFAVVIVSADAGLYRRGDVITPRLAWLSKAVA
jgi:hypothetical protein